MLIRTIITILLFGTLNTSHAKCVGDTFICTETITATTVSAGLFYFLGKNSAEAAGGFQALMYGIGFIGENETASEKALHHSLAVLSYYNFSELSKYNNNNNNKKAAEFNAISMAIWTMIASYNDHNTRNFTNKYNLNVHLTPSNVFQFTMKYNF